MQTNLGTIVETAQRLADDSTVLITNQSDIGRNAFSTQAQAGLETLVSSLNVNFAGRALFAGDDAGTTALVDADTIFASSTTILEAETTAAAAYASLKAEFETTGATFDMAFYTGGAGSAPLSEIAAGERVDYTVKANEAEMRRALFNMSVLAAAYDETNALTSDMRDGLLKLGADGLRSSITEVTSVRPRLGTAEARVASVKSRNIAADAALSIRFNELAGADSYEAALTLTELDSQLQTAFQTTARLSNLSLANFL